MIIDEILLSFIFFVYCIIIFYLIFSSKKKNKTKMIKKNGPIKFVLVNIRLDRIELNLNFKHNLLNAEFKK